MNKFYLFLFGVFCSAIIAAGCTPNITIENYKTSKQEVLDNFGTPSEIKYHSITNTYWIYVNSGLCAETKTQCLIIINPADNKVVGHSGINPKYLNL